MDKSLQVTRQAKVKGTPPSGRVESSRPQVGKPGGWLPQHPGAQNTRAVLFGTGLLSSPSLSFLAGACTICESPRTGQAFSNLQKTSGSLN